MRLCTAVIFVLLDFCSEMQWSGQVRTGISHDQVGGGRGSLHSTTHPSNVNLSAPDALTKSATVLCAGVSFLGIRFDVDADLCALLGGGERRIDGGGIQDARVSGIWNDIVLS